MDIGFGSLRRRRGSRAGAGADSVYASPSAGAARSGLRRVDRDLQDASASGGAAWRRRTAAGARPGGAAPAGGAPQGRAGGAPPGTPAEYTVTEIPGVIAAGQRWKLEWQVDGNNADGILADTDGALLLAQNDNGAIVKLVNGKVTTLFRDLNTSGALSRNTKGATFIVERGLHNTCGS